MNYDHDHHDVIGKLPGVFTWGEWQKYKQEKKGKQKMDSIDPKHYHLKIQPWDFVRANNLGFAEGNVIKYICRWKQKGGVEDLQKAKQYIQMLIDNDLEEYG